MYVLRWTRCSKLTMMIISTIALLTLSSYIVYMCTSSILVIKTEVPGTSIRKTGVISAPKSSSGRERSHAARYEEIPYSDANSDEREINVVITFTNAKSNGNIQRQFITTVNSLLRFATVPVTVYILGDTESGVIAETILSRVEKLWIYKVRHLNIDQLTTQFNETITDIQTQLKVKPGSQYSNAFYFMSMVIHKALPDLDRIIMLDCDLKINADIKELYNYFDRFSAHHVIGMAYETQPTYRHLFAAYRASHKGTKVGDPPPDGLTGFNSGVLLADLQKMRTSDQYNALLHIDVLKHLLEKYSFKLVLGDQDIFTLLSIEYAELIYVLPCTWNRQLCVWFRDNGYESVFNEYYACDGRINIYHGNCGTKIPTLAWEK